MTKPIRILHIFGRMNRGGAETFIMNVYRNIDRSKVQFDFAVETDEKGDYDDEIKDLGGRIISHPSPGKFGLRLYKKSLKSTIEKYGPYTGVHSHVHFFSGYVLKIAKNSKLPIRIAHSHSNQDGKKESLKRSIYRFFMGKLIKQNATHLLGCSQKASEALFGKKYWKDSRVRVIPNAIDLSKFKSSSHKNLREELSIPAGSMLIGHVGSFNIPKNHKFIIEIFKEFLIKVPEAKLILIGEGPLRKDIENLIDKYQIKQNVFLLGVRTDINEILASLDLFLFPSLYEGLPVSLVEAQAAGLPCIISSNITREVDLQIELIQFVSLDKLPSEWADLIFQNNIKKVNWSVRSNAIKEAGYDIKTSIYKLVSIYDRIF